MTRIADSESAGFTDRPAIPSHRAQDVAIVQRHLDAPVGVLVMHVVDGISDPVGHAREPPIIGKQLGDDFVVVQHVASDRRVAGGDLFAAHFIAATVDRVEHQLAEVGARAGKNCICLPMRMAETQQAMP